MSKIKVDTITTKNGTGELTFNNSINIAETSVPSQESGFGKLYVDSSSKNLKFLDSNNNTVDLTASSTGLTSLNGLTGATQTFGNDTNVTMVSTGTSHTLTWSGQLSHERGGLETDISNANGIIKVSNGSTSVVTDNSSDWNYAYNFSQGDFAPHNAEQNEFSFKTIVANADTGTPTNTGKINVVAKNDTDTLHIHAGDNITITTDSSNNAIKFSALNSTNLGSNQTTDRVTITSSTGTSAVIGEATSSIAGVMSTAHHDKLDAIEPNATADQTSAEIRSLVDSASDSNVFTDTLKTKLDNIADNATANSGTVESVGGTGTVSGLTLTGTVSTTGNLTLGGTLAVATANISNDAVTFDKLQNIDTDKILGRNSNGSGSVEELSPSDIRSMIQVDQHASANDTNANLRARSSHTGTQLASTISDFDTQVATTAVLKNTANTMSANIDMNHFLIDNPIFQSYREKVFSSTSLTGSNMLTMSLNNGNIHYQVLSNGNNTGTMLIAGVKNDCLNSITLILKQPSSGSTTFSFPETITVANDDTGSNIYSVPLKWQGGNIPAISSGNNSIDIFTFFTFDGGSTFYGAVAGVNW